MLKSLTPVFIFILMAFFVAPVYAVDAPSFPSCVNPQGTLVASYDTGTHGVVGGTSYAGSDKVYKLDNTSLVQCLCTTDGKGIQTNWWKASSLDSQQIEILKNQGWIYIPTGSVWGLTQDAYFAKNVDYSCTTGNGGGTGGSESSSIGQVLGLAFTGNIKLIYSLFVLGVSSLIYGQILHKSRD